MFADVSRQSNRRPGMPRRTFIRHASLLAVMSTLTLGMTVAESPVAAGSRSKRDTSKRNTSKQTKRARPEQATQAESGPVEPEQAKRAELEAGGGRTITRTFSSPGALVINDNSMAAPYPSTIQVSGIKKGKVIDVNVVLRGLNHGWSDDVDVMLVAPNGASTVLMSDAGGNSSPASLTLRMDDEASGTLPDSSTLTSGSFRPVNYEPADNFPSIGAPPATASLAQLDGGKPNGTWRLYVLDDASPDAGAFSGGWDLELTVQLDKKKKRGRGNRE